MNNNYPPIFQKIYLLTLEIYQSSKNFSKEHKYSLGEKLKNLCHEMLDLVLFANAAADKTESIQLLDFKLKNLRVYLRLAYDLKMINISELENLNKQMNDIGVQIGGWQKWAAKIS